MRRPPPVTAPLAAWAQSLTRFLARTLAILQYRDADARATEDGVLIWDRDGFPVVSRGGAFRPVVTLSDVPATASSAGVRGDMAADGAHVYFCVATDTWVRANLTTF